MTLTESKQNLSIGTRRCAAANPFSESRFACWISKPHGSSFKPQLVYSCAPTGRALVGSRRLPIPQRVGSDFQDRDGRFSDPKKSNCKEARI